MKDFNNTPTGKFYGLFQLMFDFYNTNIFDDKIKNCVLVITRQQNVMGHFSFKKWYNISDESTDELALNPSMFLQFPLIEICQTMVHEMVHAWQYHFGEASRGGYHNKEWAQKMIHIGLMPSHTGREGGKKTGAKMNDYPIKGGLFLEHTEVLLNSDFFNDLYLEINPNIITQIVAGEPLYEQIKDIVLNAPEPQEKPKSKVKYSCTCSNVWGKPNLDISCGSCNSAFIEKR